MNYFLNFFVLIGVIMSSFKIKFLISAFCIVLQASSMEKLAKQTILKAESLDELVVQGVKHILERGERFDARAGSGQQAYDVTYILLNPLNRLHGLRSRMALKYFSRELLAYFKGSLKVDEGLSQASSFWKGLADEKNEIASNYGYYVFHQKIAEYEGKTQYGWVIDNLKRNLDSRKAFININQPLHKAEKSKDFPCTIGMQFLVRENHLCCVVFSRSTDIYTGLPYDMGFFALVTELVYQDLKDQLPEEVSKNLKLGFVSMKTNFTQIYDKTRVQAKKLLECTPGKDIEEMPLISCPCEFLSDIYKGEDKTETMKWVYRHADF